MNGCHHRRRLLALLTLFTQWALFAGAPAARALDALHEIKDPPLHPSLITAEYKGKSFPVVAVAGERAEIRVDGELKVLGFRDSYVPVRALNYLPGFVHLKSQQAHSLMRTQRLRGARAAIWDDIELVKSASGDYDAVLVAAENHPDCFIAVIFFQQNAQGAPDLNSSAVAFRRIGDLRAGQETAVKIKYGYVVVPGAVFYSIPMVFSKGMEIRTDYSENSARFFRRQELIAHEKLVAQYLQGHPGGDRPVEPYLQFPPLLPDGVNPRNLPAPIEASFMVTETGVVDDLQVEPKLDPAVDHAIRRALNGWLFLPRLKAGLPVQTRVKLPLAFGDGASP